MMADGNETVDGYEDYLWDEFEVTPLTSTYFTSFSVADFEFERSEVTTDNGVAHHSWARPDAIRAGYARYSNCEIDQGCHCAYDMLSRNVRSGEW